MPPSTPIATPFLRATAIASDTLCRVDDYHVLPLERAEILTRVAAKLLAAACDDMNEGNDGTA